MGTEDPYVRMGRAADEFADTVWDSYRAIFEGALAAHERNTEITLHVFESSMETMERGAEINRRAVQEVARRMREQHEFYESISQDSNEAYSGFVGSLSDYYREVSKGANGGEEAQR